MATGSSSVSFTIQDNASSPLGSYLGNPAISSSTAYTTSNIVVGVYQAKVSSSSSVTSYTVNNGSLVSEYGTALTYTSVTGVAIANTGSANLVVGGGTDPLLGTDQYTLQPNTALVVPNVPISVSASAKQITITPASSTSWSIMIVG